MADDCYVKIDGGLFGPMSVAELRRLAKEGRINADTPIRRGERGEWFAAGRVKGLQDFLGTARKPHLLTEFEDDDLDLNQFEPKSRRKLSPGLVFLCLALAPFLFIFGCCAGFVFIPTVRPSQYSDRSRSPQIAELNCDSLGQRWVIATYAEKESVVGRCRPSPDTWEELVEQLPDSYVIRIVDEYYGDESNRSMPVKSAIFAAHREAKSDSKRAKETEEFLRDLEERGFDVR